MKLRIRSFESRETLKIEIPSTSSLPDLKQAIAENISVFSESLQLSLNRKTEIIASPIDSLSSIGITSGDLIYYTRNPNLFLSESPIQIPVPQVENQQQIEVSNLTMDISVEKIEILDASIVTQPPNTQNTVEIQDSTKVKPIDTCEKMDLEAESLDYYLSSAPSFLQKVYQAEIGNSNNKYKLLISVVHAVLLEFGFVCVDPVTRKKISGYHLPKGWDLKTSNLSVKYSLPALVRDDEEVVETVILKFNTIGEFVSVYGSLNMKDFIHLRLDASRFVPSVNYLCALNYESIGEKNNYDSIGEKNYVPSGFHEKKVFELWETVKDRLAIPLSIDLCNKTGLELPPCFMRLPTEVKMKIIELLPGIDIAKVSCVSSELRYLSSNNDLWKQKCMKEFSLSESNINSDWKRTYSMYKKNATISCQFPPRRMRPNFRPYPLLVNRRGSTPFFRPYPIIWGGERDLYPSGSHWNY